MRTLLIAIALLPSIAAAHDALPTAAAPNGWTYPISCCSNYDCREVSDADVHEGADGYTVPGGELVPYNDKRVRVSPDGKFHFCAHQAGDSKGRTICLFAPPRAY